MRMITTFGLSVEGVVTPGSGLGSGLGCEVVMSGDEQLNSDIPVAIGINNFRFFIVVQSGGYFDFICCAISSIVFPSVSIIICAVRS